MSPSALASSLLVFSLVVLASGCLGSGGGPDPDASSSKKKNSRSSSSDEDEEDAPVKFVLGAPDFATAGLGGATDKDLASPVSVASDGTQIAVVDRDNSRVLLWKATPAGNYASAKVVIGQPDLTTNTAPLAPQADNLNQPSAVAISNGKLFVADTGHNRILIYNTLPPASGASASIAVGQADMTSAATTVMNQPQGVYTDGKKLFVSDTGNNRVLVWNTIPTATTDAAPDMTLMFGPGGLADTLNAPTGILVAGGRIYLADTGNHRVLIWSALLFLSNLMPADTVLGTSGVSGLDAAHMNSPRAVAKNGSKIYVSDTGNNRVLIWKTAPVTQSLATPADLAFGQSDLTSGAVLPVSATSVSSPLGLANSGKHLFIADSLNLRVLALTPMP